MEIIIGSVVSLLVQFIKSKLGTTEYATLGVVLITSLAAAGVYSAMVHAGLWDSLVGILTTAGAFYTFIIARFEK